MSTRLLILVVFVEGFATLGIEVIALRRLVPRAGRATMPTGMSTNGQMTGPQAKLRSGEDSMHQPPSYPRKRVRMKCAFGQLSLAAAAPDAHAVNKDSRERMQRVNDSLSDDAAGLEHPEVIVRRRSRLAHLSATA